MNENNDLSAYCVDIMNEGQPNEYVAVKFSENKPVVLEFCVEYGAINSYMVMMEQSEISATDMIFYSVGPNEYHIYAPEEEISIGFDNEKISRFEFEEYKTQVSNIKNEFDNQSISSHSSKSNSNGSDDNLNYSSLDGWSVISNSYTGTVNSSKIITGGASIMYYGNADVSNISKIYGCSVVALSNTMKYYRSRGEYDNIPSSFSTLYSALWTQAGTDSTGGVTNGEEPKAAVAYMKASGYTISSSTANTYSSLKTALNADKPCLFTYGAEFGGVKGGHAIFVIGYVDTTSYQYLRVADGWNNSTRYLNYNGYSYSRTNGWSLTKP